MSKKDEIRQRIFSELRKGTPHPAHLVSEVYGISRQAANTYLAKMVEEGLLTTTGSTRAKTYAIATLEQWEKTYVISPELQEDVVYRQDIEPQFMAGLPANVENIWYYSFTEMFNNVLDHSEGTSVTVSVVKTGASICVTISDNGVGIFQKIQKRFNLLDERHAILELSKGKLTTAPEAHSGEGIFFTSRVVDEFKLVSGKSYFMHRSNEVVDWIFEEKESKVGTWLSMEVSNFTSRDTKSIFKEYMSEEDFGFHKTVIPLKLAQYGAESLISRSQAKRVLARVDRFAVVLLDFSGVQSVGQGFIDELFRVFPTQNPAIRLVEANANQEVKQMIQHVLAK